MVVGFLSGRPVVGIRRDRAVVCGRARGEAVDADESGGKRLAGNGGRGKKLREGRSGADRKYDEGQMKILPRHAVNKSPSKMDRTLEITESQVGIESTGSEISSPMEKEISKDEFLLSHFGLVVSIAQKYSYHYAHLEDLTQQGMVGLLKAYEKFDSSRGVKFSSYATYWIRAEVQSARRHGLIRHPKYIHDFEDKVRSGMRKFYAVEGRVPTVRELAQAINVHESTLMVRLSRKRSVDLCDCTGWDVMKSQTICPERLLEKASLKESIDQVITEVLSDRERQVIRGKFALDCAEGLRSRDLAQQFGLTRGRVRQIEKKALSKIRSHYLKQQEDHLDLLYLSSNF